MNLFERCLMPCDLQGAVGACWIRMLIVVLALTASRNNFPLVPPGRFIARPVLAQAGQALFKPPAKGEAVVPSRRLLESRRTDWVKALVSDSRHEQQILAPSHGLPVIHRLIDSPRQRAVDACSPLSSPRYLRLFMNDASTTFLPPPVRPECRTSGSDFELQRRFL